MSTAVNQNMLPLAWGVHHGPTDAPRKHVISCLKFEEKAAAVALAVSIKSGGHKLAYIAACTGLSESYICLLRKGKRPMREELVAPLCAATGTNLLAQVWETLDAMGSNDERREVDRMAAMLREAA